MTQRTDTDTRGVRSDTGDGEAEIQEFLDRFARALTAGDGNTVATLWETPALVMGDEMVRAVASAKEVAAFFSGAKEQYNVRGITDTRGDIQRVQWLTERIANVTVRWPYLDAGGQELGEETSTYTLRRDDKGQLKLRAVIMHGEAPKH